MTAADDADADAGADAGAGADWWQSPDAPRRLLQDLIADELQRHRRRPLALPRPWPGSLSLTDDLGVDSLELLSLATAVAEFLHLHESGIEDYLLARRTLDDWLEIAQAGLAQFSARLTFRTSGSSGAPKPCVHALATLQQEAGFLARVFAGRRRVLTAVPAHHIYGFLFTVLLPRQLGISPVDVVDLRASSPAVLAREARPGDLVVGHPDFWQAAARLLTGLPPDVVGVTSTAPCPDATAESVLQSGLARLVQVFGASETAGIGWRDSHLQPYALMPHWQGGGPEHGLVRQLPDGNVQSFASEDRLEWLDPRHFRIGPRRDHAVQVGGINVHPHRVQDVLRRHPLVADAAVRLMRPDEGSRLKAFVVPRMAVQEAGLLEDLHGWIDRELTTPERPKAIRLGAALPRTAEGKLCDWPA